VRIHLLLYLGGNRCRVDLGRVLGRLLRGIANLGGLSGLLRW
jgi:hypothetical protein